MLKQVMSDVAKERLKMKATQVFPLEKIREAHRMLHSNKIGKIVIKF